MADLSKLILPVKNTSTGVVTNQEFDLAGSGGGGDYKNFIGTTEEWNDLSAAEKAEYDAKDITDDYDGVPIDSVPTQGSTNPVQSGGTYSAINTLSTAVNNKHKVSSFEVSTSSWASDTTSQSGTTLYKKSITLSHVYVDCPKVKIGAASGAVLPTTAQQTAYDLVQYATLDGTTLYLYASATPSSAFYINVEGVD